MTLRYEINPPKINLDSDLSEVQIQNSLKIVEQRVSEISQHCDGIHFTDSVLGIPRISPIVSGKLIRKSNQELKITVSLRVRDKTIETIEQLMNESLSIGLNGVLILKGDASPNEQKESGLVPSQVVKHFKEMGFDKKIELFLSLPSNPDLEKIQKKIDAEPTGFITQVIHSVEQVSKISDDLKSRGFRIIPCILLPSVKNEKSAQFLNLDWSGYKDSVTNFIEQIHKITGDVLITSPNDFNYAKQILSSLK